MSTLPISSTIPSGKNCFSNLSHIAEGVLQVSVRVAFVAASILSAAFAFPVVMHSFAIPIIGLASGILAGFFFPEPNSAPGPYFSLSKPLIVPIKTHNEKMPESMPLGAPRGLIRQGNNCGFNSFAQLNENDPQLSQFFRNPFPEELDPFLQFLQQYDPPPAPELAQAFRDFFQNLEENLAIPQAFSNFLNQYKPQEEDQQNFNRIKHIYEGLQVFKEFFGQMDEAIQENLAVSKGNTQQLRLALSRVSPIDPVTRRPLIDPSSHRQMDLPEIYDAMFELIPPHMKPQAQIIKHLNTTNLPEPIDGDQIVQQVPMALLQLPMEDSDLPQDLQQLLENYCHSSDHESVRRTGMDGQSYNYPIDRSTISFVQAPQVLRIQLVRNKWIKEVQIPVPQSYCSLNYWFPNIFPPNKPYIIPGHAGKLTHSVDIPDQLSIQLGNEEEHRYQLVAYSPHHGGANGGHYTAGCIRDGHRYMIDDRQVVHVNDERSGVRWNDELKQSYVLIYVHMQNPDPEA